MRNICSLFFVIAASLVLAGCLGGSVPSGGTVTGPADPDSLVESGNRALNRLDPATAKSDFDAALSLAPDYAPALRGQANVAMYTKDRTTAIHYLERLTNLPDATVEDHILMAGTMAADGRKTDAIVYLEKTASLHPESAAPPTEAGLLLLETGDKDQAMAQFQRAVAIGGVSSKRAHRALGRMLFDMKSYDEATDVLVGYNDRFPGDFKVNMELGFIYFDSGRYKAALPCYRAAVESNPESIDARVGLARTLDQMGRIDSAIRIYDEAIEMRGIVREMEPVILAQADLLNQRGRYSHTLDLLEKARDVFPETPGLACARGMALAGEGRFDEAITTFGKATTDSQWRNFANEQIRRIRNTSSPD
jgi:tetratricopeptide (TPR) repeat protein